MNIDILVIGILLSLLVSELAGISPGGIIVPAYIALFFRSPLRILATFAAAAAAWGLYRLLSRRLILFGRRRFAMMILLGVLIALIIERILPLAAVSAPDLRTIGWVIPGLIANCFEKQKPVATAVLALATGGLVYAVSLLLSLI